MFFGKISTLLKFSLLSIVYFCVFAYAIPIAKAENVYLSPDFPFRPVWSDGDISLEFKMNEKLCRQNYGDNWEQKCSAILGKVGSAPKGLIAKDWPEGYWQWTGPTKLTFYPTSSWKSDNNYVVDLSSLELPARVKLDLQSASFTSLPRSVGFNKLDVWIDPSTKAEHGISFAMQFTESLSAEFRAFIESNSKITAKNSTELDLGGTEWIWLNDYTRAVAKAKILSLPKEKSIATLTIPNVRPLWYENNTWNFPDRDAYHEIIVQGTETLFSLQEVKLEAWQNKSLQMEQHLVFRFSQLVSPEELLKNLTVLELPLQRSEENLVPTNWTDGEIDRSVKQKAEKITPQLVQIPGENAENIRFRLNTKPEHYIYWSIAKGFGPTNDKGIKTPLKQSLDGVQYIAKGRPSLDILQAGNILVPGSKLSILSEHLDSIRWSAHRFKDNSLALPFITSLNYSPNQDELHSNTTVISGEISLPKADSNQQEYASKPIFTELSAENIFANTKGDLSPGLIYLRLEGIKDNKTVSSQGRILMYSQMGLVVKKLPNSNLEAYVSNIQEAKPLNNVLVQVLGKNGLPILESKTDKNGKATLSNLSNFKNEKYPTALILKHSTFMGEEDILWLSLQDYERYVNLSSFMDIEGKQSSKNSLNAFVFAERGLFKPGEKLNFGVLLRANDWKLLPTNMPLVATIFDSASRKVYQEEFIAGDNIHSFTWDIPNNVITGFYKLIISTPGKNNELGLVLGSQEVQVEMFVPDTLKIETDLVSIENQGTEPKEISNKGWLITTDKAGEQALRVQLTNLFGQAAPNRRIASTMRFYPANLKFAGFEDYNFQDTNPFFSASYDPITRPLNSINTNAKGEAILPLDFSQWRFGTLQCFISTEGFEPDGGRAVSTEQRFLLSPMPYMLGHKPGEYADNMDFIIKDSPAKLQLLAINNELKPINAGKLIFSLAQRKPITSLITDSQGRYTFAETIIDEEIAQNEQNMNADGSLIYNLPTNEVGEFLLTVKEASGQKLVLAQIPFSIVGNDDLRPALLSSKQLPKAKLHIKTDKNNYKGGETAEIMLTSPYAGVALITLERDFVAKHIFVKVPMGHSMHKLEIPQDFIGRGYIQVIMGRDPKSDNIFLQAQSVAMASISVSTDKRSIPLKIITVQKVKPGEILTFNVQNTEKKPTKAIVYAVDEGVLQLSIYKTPDPLNYLLLDRALEVQTAQLFDSIMVGSEKIMKRLSAFGGGASNKDAFAAMLGTFQNPFKRNQEAPFTWWSGVVEIPAEGLDFQVPIPDYYNGSIRIMAIAQTEEGLGSTSNNAIAIGDQVLSPQMPSMAALGDSFTGALAITNTTSEEQELSLTMEIASESQTKDITFTGLPQSIILKAKEEKVLPFNVIIGQEPGKASLNFRTKDANGNTFERQAHLSIRPASIKKYTHKNLTLNQSSNINLDRTLLPFDAETSLTLSQIPIPLLKSGLDYLQNYPYTCVEQIISKAFPLAVLQNTPLKDELLGDRSYLNQENLEKALKNAHNTLLSAYSSYNGISLWADRFAPDLFLTAYAADYLLTLKEANLPIPPGFIPQLFNTLERQINKSPNSMESLRAYAYAAWVLARAGYVVSEQLELCELYISKNNIKESDVANTLMAGAYRAIFMEKEALNHLHKVKNDAPKNWTSTSNMFDLLAQYGLHAVVMAKHFPSEFQKAIPFLQDAFTEGLNSTHATLGASFSTLGLLEILKSSAKQEQNMQDLEVACTNYSGDNQDAFANSFSNLYTLEAPNCTSFNIKLPRGQKVFAQIQEYGYDAKLPTTNHSKGINLKKTYTNISKESPLENNIAQGDVLRVDLDISLQEKTELPIVLLDLLPGGFELVLNHENDTNSAYNLSLSREEDRVIAYIDANKENRRITYHLRAISKGDFALPAAQAEGLFDRNLNANTISSRINVVEAE